MTAARWRRNAALVERCSNAIQARYARRPQLFQERRQIDRGSVHTRRTGLVCDARGAVACVATGWHCGSVPACALARRVWMPRRFKSAAMPRSVATPAACMSS
jgi:hypothetical protein